MNIRYAIAVSLMIGISPYLWAEPPTVTIAVDSSPLCSFSSEQALGVALDGSSEGITGKLVEPDVVEAMRGFGSMPLTYRLRTELGIEAWHWNPRGTWSEPDKNQGYWTSSVESSAPIKVSYGYSLPRRGSTNDQANNTSYSRLDDGDLSTFWKSNPYLDEHFTDEPSRHVQWVVIDFGTSTRREISSLRIHWAEPHAKSIVIEYCPRRDLDSAMYEVPIHDWQPFPNSRFDHLNGGTVTHQLADHPILTRFIRIRLLASSGTSIAASDDIRDRLGFAIRELEAGTLDADGAFHDAVRHAADRTQTIIYASSTDPWHRAEDRDEGTEQPGIDLVYQQGLDHGQPVLMPAGVLYDTPENAANEVQYLRNKKHAVRGLELGEEPDGQFVSGDDYGVLYSEWAKRIGEIDPAMALGGPSLQSPDDLTKWRSPSAPVGSAEARAWMGQFLEALKRRGQSAKFNFFSFEYYPFDDVCEPSGPQLKSQPQKFWGVLDTLAAQGVPRDIPWYITELGYSAFESPAEVDLRGALLNADVIGGFLSRGGRCVYAYGYQPSAIDKVPGCDAWGTNTFFLRKPRSGELFLTATALTARLLTDRWAPANGGPFAIFGTTRESTGAAMARTITAYPLQNADKRWSILLLNKSGDHSWPIRLMLHKGESLVPLKGHFERVQLSSREYAWKNDGESGYAKRAGPPGRSLVELGGDRILVLPPYSLTVLRETK